MFIWNQKFPPRSAYDTTHLTFEQFLCSLHTHQDICYKFTDDYKADERLAIFVFWALHVNKTFDVYIEYVKFKKLRTPQEISLITGPMCAGKSLSMIKRFSRTPRVKFYSGNSNKIASRACVTQLNATKITASITEIDGPPKAILVVDEVHFVDTGSEAARLKLTTLAKNHCIFLCGLVFTFQQQCFSTMNLWWLLLNCKRITWHSARCDDTTCSIAPLNHVANFSRRKNCVGNAGEFLVDKHAYFVSCKCDTAGLGGPDVGGAGNDVCVKPARTRRSPALYANMNSI